MTIQGERLLLALEAFGDGCAHERQEIEAAVETALREADPRHGLTIIAAVRLALNDPHGSLAAHDEAIRAEHHDDLIDHLKAMPMVRVASNGSYTNDRHTEGGHG